MIFSSSPLLFNVPLHSGLLAWNSRWSLSAKLINMFSTTLCHSSFALPTWVQHHYFTQVPKMISILMETFWHTLQHSLHSLHKLFFPSLPHTMSLTWTWRCSFFGSLGSYFNPIIMFWIALANPDVPSALDRNSVQFFKKAIFEIQLNFVSPSFNWFWTDVSHAKHWVEKDVVFGIYNHCTKSTILSTHAGSSQSSPFVLWSTSQLSGIIVPQTSKMDSWHIVSSMNHLVQDELQLAVWHDFTRSLILSVGLQS